MSSSRSKKSRQVSLTSSYGSSLDKDSLGDASVLKSGWLKKRGFVNPKAKTRWFVLTDDKKLHYYLDSERAKRKGHIDLTTVLFVHSVDEVTGAQRRTPHVTLCDVRALKGSGGAKAKTDVHSVTQKWKLVSSPTDTGPISPSSTASRASPSALSASKTSLIPDGSGAEESPVAGPSSAAHGLFHAMSPKSHPTTGSKMPRMKAAKPSSVRGSMVSSMGWFEINTKDRKWLLCAERGSDREALAWCESIVSCITGDELTIMSPTAVKRPFEMPVIGSPIDAPATVRKTLPAHMFEGIGCRQRSDAKAKVDSVQKRTPSLFLFGSASDSVVAAESLSPTPPPASFAASLLRSTKRLSIVSSSSSLQSAASLSSHIGSAAMSGCVASGKTRNLILFLGLHKSGKSTVIRQCEMISEELAKATAERRQAEEQRYDSDSEALLALPRHFRDRDTHVRNILKQVLRDTQLMVDTSRLIEAQLQSQQRFRDVMEEAYLRRTIMSPLASMAKLPTDITAAKMRPLKLDYATGTPQMAECSSKQSPVPSSDTCTPTEGRWSASSSTTPWLSSSRSSSYGFGALSSLSSSLISSTESRSRVFPPSPAALAAMYPSATSLSSKSSSLLLAAKRSSSQCRRSTAPAWIPATILDDEVDDDDLSTIGSRMSARLGADCLKTEDDFFVCSHVCDSSKRDDSLFRITEISEGDSSVLSLVKSQDSLGESERSIGTVVSDSPSVISDTTAIENESTIDFQRIVTLASIREMVDSTEDREALKKKYVITNTMSAAYTQEEFNRLLERVMSMDVNNIHYLDGAGVDDTVVAVMNVIHILWSKSPAIFELFTDRRRLRLDISDSTEFFLNLLHLITMDNCRSYTPTPKDTLRICDRTLKFKATLPIEFVPTLKSRRSRQKPKRHSFKAHRLLQETSRLRVKSKHRPTRSLCTTDEASVMDMDTAMEASPPTEVSRLFTADVFRSPIAFSSGSVGPKTSMKKVKRYRLIDVPSDFETRERKWRNFIEELNCRRCAAVVYCVDLCSFSEWLFEKNGLHFANVMHESLSVFEYWINQVAFWDPLNAAVTATVTGVPMRMSDPLRPQRTPTSDCKFMKKCDSSDVLSAKKGFGSGKHLVDSGTEESCCKPTAASTCHRASDSTLVADSPSSSSLDSSSTMSPPLSPVLSQEKTSDSVSELPKLPKSKSTPDFSTLRVLKCRTKPPPKADRHRMAVIQLKDVSELGADELEEKRRSEALAKKRESDTAERLFEAMKKPTDPLENERMHFVLLFTKMDAFKELVKDTPLSVAFEDWRQEEDEDTGANAYLRRALSFVRQKFLDRVKSKSLRRNRLSVHFLDALDKSQVKKVFQELAVKL